MVFMGTVLTSQSHAQDAEYELVTTAIHSRRAETALPVTTLGGEQLHDAARSTIGDTLSNEPGINNASFGPAVGQPVLRGQQGRRVLNMTNSIPNADAAGNSADHSITVEPLLANSVEVLRGPATLLYGSGAIGGVVNVIDGRVPQNLTERPRFSLESRHDTASNQNNVVGRLDFSSGPVAFHVDGLYREWNNLEIPGFAIDEAYLEEDHEDEHAGEGHLEEEVENTFGFVDNTGGRTATGTAGGSYVFDNGFVGVSVNRMDNRYGLPPGAHGHVEEEEHAHEEENVQIDMNSTRYDLIGQWNDLAPLLETVDYRLNYTDYEHFELEGAEIGTRFSNQSWQHRLQITHPEMNGWHGVIGWQGLFEEFGAVGEEGFIPITKTDSNGLFLVEDYHLDAITLEFGARVNRDRYSPQDASVPGRQFTTHSFSASALWDVNRFFSLGLTGSNSQRPPSIEELFSNFGLEDVEECVIHQASSACELGQTSLGKETSNNFDLSIFLSHDVFNATLTVFYNDFDDYISLENTGLEVNEFPVRRYEQTGAEFTGVEVGIDFRLSDNLELRVFGDTIRGDLGAFGDAPRMPPTRIGSRLTFSQNAWSAFASVLHARDQDDPGNNELPTDGYTRWDVGAEYNLVTGAGELLMFAKGRNLSDDEIRLSPSFLRGFAPEAGRSLEIGARYRF